MILRLEKAQCDDTAPASSLPAQERQCCMALAFENKLWRREAVELLFEESLWVQIGKNKTKQNDRVSLTFSLNTANFWTQKLR